MIVSEAVLRSQIRSLLFEVQVYPLKATLKDIEYYRDFKAGEFEKIEHRLRSNWDRGYSKFSQVIKKDVINSKEPIDHILDAIDSFMPYYSRVGPQMQAEIGRGDLTSSNLRGYVEGQASDKLNKIRTAKRVECRRQVPIREGEECSDFKVIHAGSDWTVVYPKTLLGSMSWAVGLADGSEEEYRVDSKNRQVGRVEWCTAAYTNNRFPMYAGNMHMYYFVKNKGYNISDVNRRLCITWSKNKDTGEVQILYNANATVDANNKDLPVKKMLSLIGKKLVKKMRVDASSRKATSLSEVASKVTLPMLKQDIENLKDDHETLIQQIVIYAKNAKDVEVLMYIAEMKGYKYNDEEVDFLYYIQQRSNRIKGGIPEEIIRKYYDHELINYRYNFANDKNCPIDLYEFFANDGEGDVRSAIVNKKDLPENIFKMFYKKRQNLTTLYCKKEIPDEYLENLFSENIDLIRDVARYTPHRGFEFVERLLDINDKEVILNIIANKKIRITNGMLNRILNSGDFHIKRLCIKRWNVSQDYLNRLISSINAEDRCLAVYSDQLEEEDLIDLSKDKSEKVRTAITSIRKLPEKLIRILSKDTSSEVRQRLLYRKVPNDVLIDFLNDKNEKVLLTAMQRLTFEKIPRFKFFKIFITGTPGLQLSILSSDREGKRTGKSHIKHCINIINRDFSSIKQILNLDNKAEVMGEISGIVLHKKFSRKLLNMFNFSPEEIVQILRLSEEEIGYYPEDLLHDEHITSIFTEDELDELSTDHVDESKLLKSYINMILS